MYGNAFGLFDSDGMFVGLGAGLFDGFSECACDGLLDGFADKIYDGFLEGGNVVVVDVVLVIAFLLLKKALA